MEDNQNNAEQQGKEAAKIAKAFDANMRKIGAICGVGGETIKLSNKVPKDNVGSLVEELFKEEREEANEGFKKDLKALLKGHAEYERAVIIERKKLEDSVTAKKKEFNKEAQALFGRIEGIGSLENSYYTALTAAGTGVAEVQITEEPKIEDDLNEKAE